MRSGFPVFFRLLRKSLRPGPESLGRFSPKRVFVMLGFVPILFLTQVLHRLAFALDDMLFPAYRKVQIHEPVFILGIPRSGTTFLHNLLTEDSEHFTSFKLWELIIAPSIIERKAWMFVGTIDGRLGGIGRKLVVALQDRIFHSLRDIHRINLFGAEEDEHLLTPIFASTFLLLPFPFLDELWHLTRFDIDTPSADKHRIMTFYRQCVQRHLYVHGPHLRFLSKNPTFSAKIDALNEYFPDAKVICSVRTPYEALPSLLSLLQNLWSVFGNDLTGTRFRDIVLEIASHWYHHPMDRLADWPENRHSFLTFDELTHSPEAAIAGIYRRLGFTMPPAFAEHLHQEQEKAGTHKSRHAYSLEAFGLTPAELVDRYKNVFTRFGFDTAYRAGSGDNAPERPTETK